MLLMLANDSSCVILETSFIDLEYVIWTMNKHVIGPEPLICLPIKLIAYQCNLNLIYLILQWLCSSLDIKGITSPACLSFMTLLLWEFLAACKELSVGYLWCVAQASWSNIDLITNKIHLEPAIAHNGFSCKWWDVPETICSSVWAIVGVYLTQNTLLVKTIFVYDFLAKNPFC